MKILVVEDEPKTGIYLKQGLVEAGFVVDLVANGLDGLHLALTEAHDLAILDVMLPGIDGWQVLQGIRRAGKDIPVLFLTARDQVEDRVKGLELGADDYLAKPFSMLELVARVRALLRRIEQLRAVPVAKTELRFGPFRLDTERRELLRGDSLIALTLREFDLLYFLVRHSERAFSRNELLQRVWGAGFDGYEHTVNSHVNRLRTKIEDDPRNPRRIVTVWGVGYRFQEKLL